MSKTGWLHPAITRTARRRLVEAVLVALATAGPAFAQEQAGPTSESLLTSSQTIIGQPLAYPAGTPKITASIVILEPGQSTSWHVHDVPLFGYVLAGELTVNYGSKGARVYPPGSALMEAVDWPHQGTNTGTTTTRILVVYMGAIDSRLAYGVEGPR